VAAAGTPLWLQASSSGSSILWRDAGLPLQPIWVWSWGAVSTDVVPAFTVGMLPFALLVLACSWLLQPAGL
jgi:hypothetical protein